MGLHEKLCNFKCGQSSKHVKHGDMQSKVTVGCRWQLGFLLWAWWRERWEEVTGWVLLRDTIDLLHSFIHSFIHSCNLFAWALLSVRVVPGGPDVPLAE